MEQPRPIVWISMESAVAGLCGMAGGILAIFCGVDALNGGLAGSGMASLPIGMLVIGAAAFFIGAQLFSGKEHFQSMSVGLLAALSVAEVVIALHLSYEEDRAQLLAFATVLTLSLTLVSVLCWVREGDPGT